MKVNDRVKVNTPNEERFHNRMGKIVLIDEGWEGAGTIKVLLDNPVVDNGKEYFDVSVRFISDELAVINE
jgi:hypothetical protein